ncbi:hypothetical protein CR513_00839, partial [Mucuna pruriens]
KTNIEPDSHILSISSSPTSNHSGTRGQWPRAFEGRHGNLLSLLEVEVQPMVFLRTTSTEDITPLGLQWQIRKKRNQNGLEGIPRIYLEERLHQLQKEEK